MPAGGVNAEEIAMHRAILVAFTAAGLVLAAAPAVLRPNFWGSPEPYFVPADQWAHEWHPPWVRHWRPRHPH
jgi:hypothetical protein